MNAKLVKNRSKTAKKTETETKTNSPIDKDVTKDTPDRAREGPNNLRQRAQWFSRRTSVKE
jgi:hypothetical protein